MAAKTTMVTLPTEIIVDEIFSKLPPKSLVRFKCVSKSYNSLISSPQFIDLQLRQSLSSEPNLLFIFTGFGNNNAFLMIDLDSPNSSNYIQLPDTLDLWLQSCISIVGSINGLICIGPNFDSGFAEFKHIVINPITRVCRDIPHNSPPEMLGQFTSSFGFGFDDINHVYKLVRITEIGFQNKVEVKVFNLEENSWKLVKYVNEQEYRLFTVQNGVAIQNHLLHWMFCYSNKYRIYCFDVRIDEWVEEVPLMDLITPSMDDIDDDDNDKVVLGASLGVLDGCLCVSTHTRSGYVAVWIMKEYALKESWVKLFSISPSSPLYFPHHGPFGFRKGSEHEVLIREMSSRGLCWCDVGSGTLGKVEEIEGIPEFDVACFFKGSFAPIPGGQKIA